MVFVGGALLAPWLWWGAQAWASEPGAPGWAAALAHQPFHRYVHRCLLGLALAGLLPMARILGCRHWRDVGLARDPRAWGNAARGARLGFLMFAALLLYELATHVREGRSGLTIAGALSAVGRASLSAIAVAVIEEILFRGVLFGGLRGSLGILQAMLLSSAVYAIVHFMDRPPAPVAVGWDSGLEAVRQMLAGSLSLARLVPGFFTLFAAGTLLAWMYQRTGTLYFSMGLHSGWVFWIKMRGWVTAPGSGATASGGRWELVSGWPALVVIVIVLAWIVRRDRVKIQKGSKSLT